MPGTKEEEGADKGKEETPLQPVGEGAEDLQQSAKGGGQDDDERRAAEEQARQREEDEGREDARAGGDRRDDDPDGDDRRDPRDMTQREKRDRRRRARDRDRTELRYLRHRNEQLERSASENAKRMDRLEEGQVGDKITRLRSALKNADVTIARLSAEGEAAQAVEATNLKANLETQLRAEEQRLADMKRGREERGGGEERAEERGEERRRPMPMEVRRNLEDWYDRNPWFDAERPDTDSQIAMALDKSVQADGYDPRDPEYYEELDRRIADYMPHIARRRGRGDDDRGDRDNRDDRARDKDRDDDRGERRERQRGRERDDDRDRDRDRGGDRRNGDRREVRGPVFRVGGRDRPLRENEVYLSAERRKALEDMGVMDDPLLRNRYLKSFKKYDEEHPPSRRDR